MTDRTCAVLVVGGGPGGYVAAIRTAQHGLDTVIVDAGPMGGTCLNVGCIPSKALIHVADEMAAVSNHAELGRLGIRIGGDPTIDLAATVGWKDGVVGRLRTGVERLLDAAGATRITGRAVIVDGKTVRIEQADGSSLLVRAEHLVIATGSRPVELPHLPFGGPIISSTDALALTEMPAELVVVGAGYIGLELGIAFRKFGARVTVVEMADRILPQYDSALTAPVAKRLAGLDVPVLLRTLATGWAAEDGALVVGDHDGHEQRLPADRVLVTVGRTPVVTGFGLESLDLGMDGKFIRVDDRCRTSMRGVYAIGDVTGEPMLAHRATAQGELVADVIAGHRRAWDSVIPEVCFTDPEIVSVGMSPERAADAGVDVITETFPFAASGRALTLDRGDGFVRIVARREDHLVVGAQAVGAGVAELSGELVTAIEMGSTLEDVASIVHAHPTLAESIGEAAMKALGHGLHVR